VNHAQQDEKKRQRKVSKGLASNAPTPPFTPGPGSQTPATRPASISNNTSTTSLAVGSDVGSSTPPHRGLAEPEPQPERNVIVDMERNEVILLRRDWKWLGLKGKKVVQREEQHEEVRPSFRDINPLPIMVSIFRQPTNAIVLLGSGRLSRLLCLGVECCPNA
jgi:hypothetical protein